ncbi:hypothetical protein [Rhodococcus sp. (in: high G+C Gram-positive bacteria)]|uniref:hypothetical protein n=1 Tax=Rhodococcus sp. TaxID=1831 RepID=UPI003BB68437
MTDSAGRAAPLRVLVYSHDASIRAQVVRALGTGPDAGLPELEYLEVATAPVVIRRVDEGGIDLVVLDGEATPVGGMGLAKQLRDEVDPCPPLLLLLGRPDDAWLASWSQADAAVALPVDPFRFAELVVALLRRV